MIFIFGLNPVPSPQVEKGVSEDVSEFIVLIYFWGCEN
jgi:hypothetical protein